MSSITAAAGTLLLLALAASPAAAQSGAFITRLGNDTVGIERYTRTGNTLEGDLVVRAPRTRQVHYVATYDGDNIRTFEVRDIPLDGSGVGQVTTMTFAPEAVTQRITRGDSTRTVEVRAGGARTALIFVGYPWALYQQAIGTALAGGRDSAAVQVIFPGSPRVTTVPIVRHGGDSVMVGFFGDPGWARVNAQGRLTGYDGSQTTNKVKVERVAEVPLDRLARDFAARDNQGRAVGQLSPRDTVRATVGSAHLMVDYGRPSARGREVFGGIVPWGRVWRMGANAATQFETDRNLEIGGKAVPAGKYTLWTVPTRDGATLIINSQTGQWGTDYDASKDFVKVPLSVKSTAQPVERFTIAIEPGQGNQGTLSISWADRRMEAPVRVK